MNGPPTGFWGKLEQLPDGSILAWHPLENHCADVAACCEALLNRTLLRVRLASLGWLNDLTATQVQRLCVFAAFHDIGKFNIGFQNKARSEARRAGHVAEVLALFGDTKWPEQDRLCTSIPLEAILGWAPDEAGLRLLVAAICHHGRPIKVDGALDYQPLYWRPDGDRDPFAGIATLSDRTRIWFPAAFGGGDPLPVNPEFQHGFSGLVTLADWIGSDTELFRYSDNVGEDRMPYARAQAAVALRSFGIDIAPARAALGSQPPDFTAVAPFAARDLQTQTLGLPLFPKGSLALLEAETGSGKTEAALARFLRLFHAGEVDALYFALPTRTAASQMHRRVVDAIVRAFPDVAVRPPVILAVPGYLVVDDRTGHRLPGFEVLWNDDPGERFRFRGWAAENPKRYLAGPIVIGTVDQVLLSSLTVSHAHMRASALLRHLLVVDEVHASDSYMITILHSVLTNHLAAGGHALLMSATLGTAAREKLFAAASKERGLATTKIDQARSSPYPMLTANPLDGRKTIQIPLRSDSVPKNIRCDLMPFADDYDAVATMALDAVECEARVIVIRNTVRDCISTQLAVEAIAAKRKIMPALFACQGVIAPHHSRFAKDDRAALDTALEGRFGKDAATAPCVVVATQTVQQSLDLDADYMLTDICPMDVLLQRLGRLHRHRRERPQSFNVAQAAVVTPAQRDLGLFIRAKGQARGDHGLGTVYEDLRIIENTWRALLARPTLSIPTMNRQLVEETTHPEALAALVEELGAQWQNHAAWCDGAQTARSQVARLNLVNRSEPFGDYAFPSGALERRIMTRLGEGDRIVEFGQPWAGPFGYPVRRLVIPAHFAHGTAPDAVPASVVSSNGQMTFVFGQLRFVYDRLGLRLSDNNDPALEDSTDA